MRNSIHNRVSKTQSLKRKKREKNLWYSNAVLYMKSIGKLYCIVAVDLSYIIVQYLKFICPTFKLIQKLSWVVMLHLWLKIIKIQKNQISSGKKKRNSPNNTLQQHAHHNMLKLSSDLYKGITWHFQRNITQKCIFHGS